MRNQETSKTKVNILMISQVIHEKVAQSQKIIFFFNRNMCVKYGRETLAITLKVCRNFAVTKKGLRIHEEKPL